MVSLEDISCNICTKEFETNVELKYHMIRQHKEDPVSCEECGKEPLNKYALRSHMSLINAKCVIKEWKQKA